MLVRVSLEADLVLALLGEFLLRLLLDLHLEVVELERLDRRVFVSNLHAASKAVDTFIEELISDAEGRILSVAILCLCVRCRGCHQTIDGLCQSFERVFVHLLVICGSVC